MSTEMNLRFDFIAATIEEVSGIPRSEIKPDHLLVEDLEIDSLTMVEIAFSLQRAIGVEIPEEKIADVRTPKDLLALL